MEYKKLDKHLKSAYRTAAKNAVKRGIQFDLSKEDFAAIATRAGGKCELTGIAFDHTKHGEKWARRPWAASLDRINNAQGYSDDNCRLLCVAVNLSLNTWGQDALYAVARGLLGFDDAAMLAGVTKRFPGVRSWKSHGGIKFNARIKMGKRTVSLGTFDTAEEAFRVYRNAKCKQDLSLETH